MADAGLPDGRRQRDLRRRRRRRARSSPTRRGRDRVRRLARDGGEDRPRGRPQADADRGERQRPGRRLRGRGSRARREGRRVRRLLLRRPGLLRDRARARGPARARRLPRRGRARGGALDASATRSTTTTLVGPMQNEPTAQKMDAHLEDAVAKGAEVVVGGVARGRPADAALLPADRRRPTSAATRSSAATRRSGRSSRSSRWTATTTRSRSRTSRTSDSRRRSTPRDLARAFRFADGLRVGQRGRERLDDVLGDAPAVRRRGRDEDGLGPGRRAPRARGHDRPAHDHPRRGRSELRAVRGARPFTTSRARIGTALCQTRAHFADSVSSGSRGWSPPTQGGSTRAREWQIIDSRGCGSGWLRRSSRGAPRARLLQRKQRVRLLPGCSTSQELAGTLRSGCVIVLIVAMSVAWPGVEPRAARPGRRRGCARARRPAPDAEVDRLAVAERRGSP